MRLLTRQCAALDTGGRHSSRAWGPRETGEMVIECKESSQNRPQGTVCAVFWTLTAGERGTTCQVTIRAKEIMKSRPNAKSLHLADNYFFKEK